MRSKYFKPKSLTWWASAAPLAAGIILATEPLHAAFDLAQTLRNLTGEVPPIMLINAGLAGIGIRRAMP